MKSITRRTAALAAMLAAAALLVAAPMAYATSSPSGTRVTAVPDGIRVNAVTEAVSGCHSIGGGKYNCFVYHDAPSYFSGDRPAGILHAGWNYFYCQLSGSERFFQGHQNYWFGVTDDDSGNQHVYVNVVYLSGGADDAPEPGLPVGGC